MVRLTARTSTLIFVASVAADGTEIVAPRASFSRRGAGWKLVTALLVSHTIHFCLVYALATETHGRNITSRGGWVLTTIVGILFYAFTLCALALRRVPSEMRGLANVLGDAACSGLVGLAFLVTYLGRFGTSPMYTFMVWLVAPALIAFTGAAAVRIIRDRQTLGWVHRIERRVIGNSPPKSN